MKVIIDENSGFCFGVIYAISKAEEILKQDGKLYVLGDIVHNDEEVKRLKKMGLKVISREDLKKLKDTKVLIRAHGEPAETYSIAFKNNIQLIDASCPIVLRLQNQVRQAYLVMKEKNGQVVIYGKPDHPEVIALRSQADYKAIVIQSPEDLDQLDFSRPIAIFAQTTKNLQKYYQIIDLIHTKMKQINNGQTVPFYYYDTVCRQVANRDKQLQIFCKDKDVILFVSGKKSSNGRMLYGECKKVNPNTYFISSPEEIDINWFKGNETVGICGATSTPQWLMLKVKEYLMRNFNVE